MLTLHRLKIIETKSVGILYHITSIKGVLSIIKTNQLQGAINGISTTRNKNAYKEIRGLAGCTCQLVLDGTKLSNKFSIEPYQDTTEPYGDEYEEVVNTRLIKNIDKYILEVQLLHPENWRFLDKDVMILNRLMGKPIDFNLTNIDIINYVDSLFPIAIL